MVTGRLDSFASRRNRPISPVLVLEVRDDLHPALAGLAHRMGDRGQLGFLGAQGRDAPSVGGAVIERARGREAERPGAQPFGGELRHALAVLRGGGFAVGAALAHHVDAQGGMRHLGGNVDIVRPRGDGIEEIREAVPVPGQALAQHDFGNVFHAFHEVDQHVVLVFVARREAHTAIAEEDGRGAVPGRRRQPVTPGHLRVVMRVHIDEARRHELAARVDLLGPFGNVSADRRDLAVDHGEVGFIGITARPVDDGAVANHQAGRGHADAPMRWRPSYRQESRRGKRGGVLLALRWPARHACAWSDSKGARCRRPRGHFHKQSPSGGPRRATTAPAGSPRATARSSCRARRRSRAAGRTGDPCRT